MCNICDSRLCWICEHVRYGSYWMFTVVFLTNQIVQHRCITGMILVLGRYIYPTHCLLLPSTPLWPSLSVWAQADQTVQLQPINLTWWYHVRSPCHIVMSVIQCPMSCVQVRESVHVSFQFFFQSNSLCDLAEQKRPLSLDV